MTTTTTTSTTTAAIPAESQTVRLERPLKLQKKLSLLDTIAPTPLLASKNLTDQQSDKNDMVLLSCPDDNHDDDNDVNAFDNNKETPDLANGTETIKTISPSPVPVLALTGPPLPDNNPSSLSDQGIRSFSHYFEDDPAEVDKTYPGAIYSAYHVEDNQIDHDLPFFMEPIEHLSEHTIGRETGLPEWTFYAYGADDGEWLISILLC
jgi:hypothetical protein